MKKINLKKLMFSCCTVALLAIGCSDNNQKSVTDDTDNAENMSDAYDLKATTDKKVLEVEQDAINYYWPVSDEMSYRLLMDDVDLKEKTATAKLTNEKKKDFSGLDDKNDLPVAKVVREEPEDDYWLSYDQRQRKYQEMSRKMKDAPEKLDTDVNKVKSKGRDKADLKGNMVYPEIKITDINRSRPPLFTTTCMGEINPEKCSNKAITQWVKENINYPKDEIDQEHDGYEYASFTVGKNGEIIGDIKIKSRTDNCPECEEAAREVLSKMPKWTPALQNGKPVSVEVNLPIRFRFL